MHYFQGSTEHRPPPLGASLMGLTESNQTKASWGNDLLVQGHTRDLKPENQSPRRSPALWAVVTNELCISDVERS